MISTFAFAADTYRGNLESTNKVGKTVNWQFDVTYQAKDNKDITGTLRVWGQVPAKATNRSKVLSTIPLSNSKSLNILLLAVAVTSSLEK